MKRNPKPAVVQAIDHAISLVDGDDKQLLLMIADFFKNSKTHVVNIDQIRKSLGLEMIIPLRDFWVVYSKTGLITIKSNVFSNVHEDIPEMHTEKRNRDQRFQYEGALLNLPRPMSLDEIKTLVKDIDCDRKWKLARIDHLPDAAIENEQFQSRGAVVALGSMKKESHGWTAPCVSEHGNDESWGRNLDYRYFSDNSRLPVDCQYLIVRKK